MTTSKKKDHQKWIEEATLILESYIDLQKQLRSKKTGFTFDGKPLPVKNIPLMKKDTANSISFWRNEIREHKLALKQGLKGVTNNKSMATTSRKPKKKPGVKALTRLISRTEKKTLSQRFYSYINLIDGLILKNINPQQKADLKKFKASIKKASPHLTKF